MKKFQTFGVTEKEESQREIRHRKLAREAAAEGMVLLKNENVLPLSSEKIALYGSGARMTVKGGSGSGDVRERHSVSIEEGLRNAGCMITTEHWLNRFSEKYDEDITAWKKTVEEKIKGYGPFRVMQMFDVIHECPKPFPQCISIRKEELTDKKDIAVYVLARQAGEGGDRRVEKGDYLLSDVEKESLRLLSDHYDKLILILNCGSVMDLSILDEIRIDAVLLLGQGGMEGGNALADVLLGKVLPSGKLTDSWAFSYDDYPSADSFGYLNGNLEEEEYKEGVYVGYRWFEKNGIRPRYPFGYGLSYTSFKVNALEVSDNEVVAEVINTGSFAGKETVALYVKKPEGKYDHEIRSLIGFAKTGTLRPSEKQNVTIPVNRDYFRIFDEERHVWVLEKGTYELYLNDLFCGSFEILEEEITAIEKREIKEEFSARLHELLNGLTDRQKTMLVTGGAYPLVAYNNVMGAAGRTCTKLLNAGIPNIVLADGPAGINVNQSVTVMKDGLPRYPDGLPEDWKWGWLKYAEPFVKGRKGKGQTVYRYMTAWPSETVLAQSWNEKLLYEVGKAVGTEMKEIGVSVWLAPGLNIHRNPLCGRNFEYYSEDPVISGKMASAVTRGVQSMGGIGVAIKHFCCNNQEDNRTGVSANVSQRALREIYLRAFEIAVKEGKPWTVMSSYNRVNGKYAVNSEYLINGVLREEWGFDGLVMSDWNSTDKCSHSEAINAGNDLIMPGRKDVSDSLLKDLNEGKLDRDKLEQSCLRVLKLIFDSETCKDFK